MANLFSDLDRRGFHSSIMTTYSVDPAFYDGSIQRRLRAMGCEDNILIADAAMLERALAATPEAFADAGRRYALVPAHASSCFHPKILLRLGKHKARVTIGSANATAAGWGVNRELVAIFDAAWSPADDAIDTGPLVRRLYDYLASFLDIPGDVIAYKLDLHAREAPWLFDVAPASGPIALPDGSAVDVLCERGDGSSSGMMRQFVDRIGDDRAHAVTIVSPYWDMDLAALREFAIALPDARFTIALDPRRGSFPKAALTDDPWGGRLHFVDLSEEATANRFLHAKLIVVETAHADHVLFGSANCSDDALGRLFLPARNAEVDIYRRLARGAFFGQLPLDLTRPLDLASVAEPEIEKVPVGGRMSSFPGGTIEIADGALLWFPSREARAHAASARLRLAADDLVPLQLGNGLYRARGTAAIEAPAIVRAVLADGRVSAAMIAHDDRRLRAAAPGSTSARLRTSIARIHAGERDFITLAHHIHDLFGESRGARPAGSGRRRAADAPFDVIRYASPQAFREAMIVRAADGRSGRTLTDQTSLREILRLLANGLDLKKEMEAEDKAEDEALKDGDAQDGEDDLDALDKGKTLDDADEEDEGADTRDAADPIDDATDDDAHDPTSSQASGSLYDMREITALRRALDRGTAAIEADLQYLRQLSHASIRQAQDTFGADGALGAEIEDGPADTLPDVHRMPAQVAILLVLLLQASCTPLPTADGPVLLFAPAPRSGIMNRDHTLVVRAGKILQQLYSGNDRAIAHIRVEPGRSLPDDLFELLVISRFTAMTICRVCEDAGLLKIVAALAVEVEAVIRSFGALDERVVEERIAALRSMLKNEDERMRVRQAS